MKKTLCLTSLLAIMATNAAIANTDVTFGGKYLLPDGTEANVSTNVGDTTYTYTKTDGSNATAAYDEDPNLTYFTYTNKDGITANLSSGTGLTQSDFNADSAATGDVITTQTIAAGETADRANYTYVNGKGNTVVLGDAKQSFTESYNLLTGLPISNDYTIALADNYITSVDVTDGTPDNTLDGTHYILHASNNNDYRLNEDGTEIRKVSDGSIVNIADFPDISSELTALQNAYTSDVSAINDLKTQTGYWATDETTAWGTADTIFNTDSNKINTLNGYYTEYTDALSALDAANSAKADAVEANTENIAYQTAARNLYNSSIETTLASVEQNAKDYADNLASNYDAAGSANTAEQNAKDYADNLASNYDAAGTSATETARATAEEASIRSDFAAADTATLTAANGYAAAQDAITLTTANGYTDTAVLAEAARVDATMGTIHGLVGNANATTTSNGKKYNGNLAVGTTVEDHLLALDDSIGDRRTLNGNHVSKSVSVVENLQSLNDDLDAEIARATTAEASIRSDFAAADALTLNQAKAYADNINALNLQAAKSYTDERIQKLDKDLSAGIASSVALSSVSVSNVQKGEVSVGAGYGLYNGQSAMAFGAAMGLSNNWSVNAGAGISNSDFSFRAGTNYKFKLF